MAEPRGSMSVGEHPVDQVAVADEVDLLDAGRAVGDAGAGQQRVDRAAALVDGGVDRGLVGRGSRGWPSRPASVTSAKSITTTSAPASRASSAAAAPMPVAPPTTRTRLPS